MKTSLSLFISHSWDESDRYEELKSLLDEVHGDWSDLSIPRGRAIAIAAGAEAPEQQKELLLERLKAIGIRLDAIEASRDDVARSLADVREELAELRTCRDLDLHYERAQERILERGYVEVIKRLGRLKRKYGSLDLDRSIEELHVRTRSLLLEIDRFASEGGSLEREAKNCWDSIDSLTVNLGETGKHRDYVVSKYPSLALAIHNRIGQASAVLVVATQHLSYRAWMEFEYQEAFVMRKPVFALLQCGFCESLPPDLARFGVLPVSWERSGLEELLAGLKRPGPQR